MMIGGCSGCAFHDQIQSLSEYTSQVLGVLGGRRDFDMSVPGVPFSCCSSNTCFFFSPRGPPVPAYPALGLQVATIATVFYGNAGGSSRVLRLFVAETYRMSSKLEDFFLNEKE